MHVPEPNPGREHFLTKDATPHLYLDTPVGDLGLLQLRGPVSLGSEKTSCSLRESSGPRARFLRPRPPGQRLGTVMEGRAPTPAPAQRHRGPRVSTCTLTLCPC